MKKTILSVLILVISIQVFSVTLVLKDSITLETNKIMLNDIILTNPNLDNILIKETDKYPIILYPIEIIDILFKNNIYDALIIGDSIKINSKNSQKSNHQNSNLISELESILSNFININNNNFKLIIDLEKISPDLDINLIDDKFLWSLDKIDYDISNITDLKNVKFKFNNKNYEALIKINIYSNVYIAKKNITNNEIIIPHDFYIKNLEISKLKFIKDIVTDINDAANYQIIKELNPTDFLRWSNIKKTPLIKKGEDLTLLLNKEMIEIKIPCIALSDGYSAQKMKVRLKNGNEKTGNLKKIEGKFYVEIN